MMFVILVFLSLVQGHPGQSAQYGKKFSTVSECEAYVKSSEEFRIAVADLLNAVSEQVHGNPVYVSKIECVPEKKK